jgi:hypothetical protein
MAPKRQAIQRSSEFGSNTPLAVSLRATSSLVTFWVVVGAAAVGITDAVLRGSWPVLLHALAPIAFGAWIAWSLLYLPSIRIEADGLVVVNLARIFSLPWNRIRDIRRRFQLVIELDDGSIVECWGGPFPSRTGARRAEARADPSSVDPALNLLRSALSRAQVRQHSSPQVAPVARRWDVRSLSIGAVLLVLTALSATLPI